ncbi:18248_t:CDS:2 [Acaulospora morrowiae]|uniref:18248_t:CDS:1 n=1 Tax=Acaulospora morrowiae TaxID=94023 RepID=A0A9N8VVF4_9GLOM|nr:18248_t:CDS:2 [Acaulospora morrowiae]
MTNIARKLLNHSEIQFPTIVDAKRGKNLFELINVYPEYGVGIKVVPDHWVKKGITKSYYEITRVSLKMKASS